MRILIAEDDRTSRLVLERTITRLGYELSSAEDGEEALSLFHRDRPQVVITDWMMPRLDGLELCRRIREETIHDRYTYLIVLTALGGKQNYLEAMDAGTDDFITKPFDTDELVTRLRVAERIVGMEQAMSQLESMLGCCPDCRRVPGKDGKWLTLRQLAAMPVAADRPAARCPGCRKAEAKRA
ncbi:MAG TPA: response regulator [Gemmatimonadales bacterium]|nr:response regulator [Gemmatimonadales bacterium]